MAEITVVGGGLSGLAAAITAAERGHRVRLLEKQRRLGGRARSTKPPYVANFGGHVVYGDGPWWEWLRARDIVLPHEGFPLGGVRFRVKGSLHKTPPAAAVRAWFKLREKTPPSDCCFRDWLRESLDDVAADLLIRASGVFTFDYDPGRLSAEFVWSRLRRVVTKGMGVKYIRGGWSTLVTALTNHARSLGVAIETGCAVDALPPPPIVLAVPLASARKLLGDPSVSWGSTRTALLDLALEKRRGDPFIVWDLEEGGWVERYSRVDPSLAPEGVSLIQAHAGLRPEEELESGIARLERLIDESFPDWRARTAWRRNNVSEGETGAVDLPGAIWADRPAIDQGNGILLAGDEVAAPGLLSEVALTSAMRAAELAIGCLNEERKGRKLRR